MTWYTYLQSLEKIHQWSYSAKTKRDGQTDRQMDVGRGTDGQTDRRGALQYLPSRAFGAAGDNNIMASLK